MAAPGKGESRPNTQATVKRKRTAREGSLEPGGIVDGAAWEGPPSSLVGDDVQDSAWAQLLVPWPRQEGAVSDVAPGFLSGDLGGSDFGALLESDFVVTPIESVVTARVSRGGDRPTQESPQYSRDCQLPTPSTPSPSEHELSLAGTLPNNGALGDVSSCECLQSMVQLLEDQSIQRRNDDPDVILQGIGCGIKAFGRVLECASCNICAANAMLIAMVAQRLSNSATTVAGGLCAAVVRDDNPMVVNGALGRGFHGTVTMGCYNIENHTIKSALVNCSARLHLEGLWMVLQALHTSMTNSRGARLRGEAADAMGAAMDKISKSHTALRQLFRR